MGAHTRCAYIIYKEVIPVSGKTIISRREAEQLAHVLYQRKVQEQEARAPSSQAAAQATAWNRGLLQWGQLSEEARKIALG